VEVTLEDLKQQLAIDKSSLDDEVIRQPVLFYNISEQLTEAIAERDGAKEDLASTDAGLDNKWRTKLKALPKVTEAMVSNHVLTDPEHEKAFDVYLAAKTKADKLQALKEAFQQRSYMLRDLVSLYTANYYEDSAIKPSRAQEASHYAANRARISNARVARGK
jgi:ATP phosphoribosyltransferase regulatory subunit HisZ